MRLSRIIHRGEFYLLLFCLAIIVVYWVLSAPIGFPIDRPVTVAKGLGVAGISRDLARDRVIQSPLFFELVVKAAGIGEQLQAGDYWFEQKISLLELIKRLKNGTFVTNPVKLTIPEGATASQIATIVNNKLPNLSPLAVVEALETQPEIAFPDTYFLPPQVTLPALLELWQDHFQRQVSDLQSASSTLTWHQNIVLASIIEEEMSIPADRRLVSGVLHKRLEIGMPLQVDVALITYDEVGLPEHAITNISRNALEAALYPEASDYWYYLSDRYGVTHYARDFEEHKANRRQYLD